jgi:endonuclease-3
MKRVSKILTAKAEAVNSILAEVYPDAKCALNFRSPLELLVATILSAQCTDARVNMVTPVLFEEYPTVESLANAKPEAIEKIIQSTGFFRNKTRSIIGMAKAVVRDFHGEVPHTMEELVTLPGAGRKTANVVLGNSFGVPGLPVDTHMQRVNQRLGLTKNTDPVKIEFDLMQLLPESEWTQFSHRIIQHGRTICIARKPLCEQCPVRDWCDYYTKLQKAEGRALAKVSAVKKLKAAAAKPGTAVKKPKAAK